MPATYEPIATTTLSSAASTITFSSIPSTYTDLRLVIVGAGDGQLLYWTYNSDTASNYSWTRLLGNGSAASSTAQTNLSNNRGWWTNASSTPCVNEIDVFSYAGSTNKTSLVKSSVDQNGSGNTVAAVNLWRSTSAITSIQLSMSSGNFYTGTTATIYGIKAA